MLVKENAHTTKQHKVAHNVKKTKLPFYPILIKLSKNITSKRVCDGNGEAVMVLVQVILIGGTHVRKRV